MDIKEYLREVRDLKRDMVAKQEERAYLHSLVSNPGSMHPKEIQVQTSLPMDKLGDIVSDVADIDAVIVGEIASYTKMIGKAHEIVNSASNPTYRAILTQYYLLGYNWDKVADENGYSPTHIRKLHGWALKELYEKYDTK